MHILRPNQNISGFSNETYHNQRILPLGMHALQTTPTLEQIAREETARAGTAYDKAKALDNYMRRTIRADTQKIQDIARGLGVSTYKNSVETFESRSGVCGEQALLYMVLARAAGLSCCWVDVGRTHSVSRVKTPEWSLNIDHTNACGFDYPVSWWNSREISDHEVEQRFKEWNPGRHIQEERLHYQAADTYPLPTTYLPSPFAALQPIAKALACLCTAFILPSAWDFFPVRLELHIPQQHPFLVSAGAYEHLERAKQLAASKLGIIGPDAVTKLQESYDANGNHILDTYEAAELYNTMYDELVGD